MLVLEAMACCLWFWLFRCFVAFGFGFWVVVLLVDFGDFGDG